MTNSTDLSEYDRDTLDYLRAAGVAEGLLARVRATLVEKTGLRAQVAFDAEVRREVNRLANQMRGASR